MITTINDTIQNYTKALKEAVVTALGVDAHLVDTKIINNQFLSVTITNRVENTERHNVTVYRITITETENPKDYTIITDGIKYLYNAESEIVGIINVPFTANYYTISTIISVISNTLTQDTKEVTANE